MSDFDYWASAPLATLVDSLRAFGSNPPPPSDDAFWSNLIKECIDVDIQDEVKELSAKQLAQGVLSEFEQAKFTWSTKDVAVGDLGCAESRLLSQVHELRGVIFIASHPMEPLWGADGIMYHTVVVSAAIEPSNSLSSQLLASCNFVKEHRPALICSCSPTMTALVLAAYEHRESAGTLPVREALAAASRTLGIGLGEIGPADLAELDTFSYMACMTPPTTAKVKDNEMEAEAMAEVETSLSTPRSRVTQLPTMGSTDSSATQIESEMLADCSPITTPKTKTASMVRNGFWKRSRSHEGDDLELDFLLDEHTTQLSYHTRAEYAKRAACVLDEPITRSISRGDCAVCEQVNVLGWTHSSQFECCACHDANDDEEA